MSNYTLKVNLMQLEGAIVAPNKAGEEGIFIPISKANLFKSANTGAVYLDIDMWESQNTQYGTHSVVQNMSKDAKAAWLKSHPDQKFLPRLGNAKVIAGGAQQQVPQQVQQMAQNLGAQTNVQPMAQPDSAGLPF